MAEINYYKTYSIVSTVSDRENVIIETIFARLDELKKTNSIKVAKKILEDSFGITKNYGIAYIEGAYPIELYEDSTIFSVNIFLKDRNIAYYYKKGEKNDY